MSEVKPKTLAEFKQELKAELKSDLDAELKKLQAGYGELRGLYHNMVQMHKRGKGGLTEDGKHLEYFG